jgi:hypothetical protein
MKPALPNAARHTSVHVGGCDDAPECDPPSRQDARRPRTVSIARSGPSGGPRLPATAARRGTANGVRSAARHRRDRCRRLGGRPAAPSARSTQQVSIADRPAVTSHRAQGNTTAPGPTRQPSCLVTVPVFDAECAALTKHELLPGMAILRLSKRRFARESRALWTLLTIPIELA